MHISNNRLHLIHSMQPKMNTFVRRFKTRVVLSENMRLQQQAELLRGDRFRIAWVEWLVGCSINCTLHSLHYASYVCTTVAVWNVSRIANCVWRPSRNGCGKIIALKLSSPFDVDSSSTIKSVRSSPYNCCISYSVITAIIASRLLFVFILHKTVCVFRVRA